MFVTFKRNRLHVGMRRRDWTDVWYEPIMSAWSDADGSVPMALFSNVKGMESREPMDGEVYWHAHFDIANCESKSRRERDLMQRRFMYDAYRYCIEKDPEKVAALELDLDEPGFMRWQSWFCHAKIWKKKQLRDLKANELRKQRKREMQAQMQGIPIDEVELSSDSDLDSAFESADERPVSKAMNSPLTPPATATKRKAQPKKTNNGPKRPKTSSSNNRKGSFYMSGGLGNNGNEIHREHDSDEGENSLFVQEVNGTLNEDEALEQAIRESVAPQSPPPL